MALKGRNTVGISATGSGKTLGTCKHFGDDGYALHSTSNLSCCIAAFLLPAMIHINAQVRQ